MITHPVHLKNIFKMTGWCLGYICIFWSLLTLSWIHILNAGGKIHAITNTNVNDGKFYCSENQGFDFGYTCTDKFTETIVSYIPKTLNFLFFGLLTEPLFFLLGIIRSIPYAVSIFYIFKIATRSQKLIKYFLILGAWLIASAPIAHAETITITGDACAVAATPAPDVEYEPGVDVNGKPVAPADLPDSAAMPWPQNIQIPLQLNLQNALHLPNNSNLVAPQAVVGTIEYKDGQLTFNGKPISQDAQADIQAACQHSRQEPQKPIITHKDLLKGD